MMVGVGKLLPILKFRVIVGIISLDQDPPESLPDRLTPGIRHIYAYKPFSNVFVEIIVEHYHTINF